jgi:NAD(P)-dependent dehydrogenase (short-subunit alcohol dehydrogenase family)
VQHSDNGQGIAPALVKAGVRGIALLATNADRLNTVARELEHINPRVETLVSTVDITDNSAVAALFAEIRGRWGHADILVNNGGVLTAGEDLHEVDPVAWLSNITVNLQGAFLLTHHFLKGLPDPKSTPATVINMTTGVAHMVIPGMSGYTTSKLGLQHVTRYVAAQYPNVAAVSLSPGLVDTDLLQPYFRQFDLDTPALTGGTVVWIARDPQRAGFLSGRYVSAEWSVEDLVERKDEIVGRNLLTVDMLGTFGKEQFE